MGDLPDKIPIELMGQEAYIDLTRPSIAHYRFTEESTFAEACWEKCDPEALQELAGHQSVAEFCMMNAMQGGKGGEYIIDMAAICRGPERKLFRGEHCGAKIARSVTGLPFDEDHPEFTDAEETPED